MQAFDTVHTFAFNSQREHSPMPNTADDSTLPLAASPADADAKRSPPQSTSLDDEFGDVSWQRNVGAAKANRGKQRNPEWLRKDSLERQIAVLEQKHQAIKRVCALRQARAFINAQIS